MTQLYIASDIHLEFCTFQPPKSSDDADVIVLPGDIWKGNQGIYWARQKWPEKDIVYVAGNHEFYGHQRVEVLAALRLAAEEKHVHFLDNDEVLIDGTRFIGATLWTDFNLFGFEMQTECMIDCQRALYDFEIIREGDRRFSPSDALRLHLESIRWLEFKLKNEHFDGPTIVVTHHSPSWLSVVPRFQKDLASAGFASRLEYLLGYSQLWIHGHMHDSLDYQVNGTRVICNPRGYCRYDKACENISFNPGLIVEVAKAM